MINLSLSNGELLNPEESEQNKQVIDNFPHTYNPAIKGWVYNNNPPTGFPAAGMNLSTVQIEMKELKAPDAIY